jgi:hypothetical protein
MKDAHLPCLPLLFFYSIQAYSFVLFKHISQLGRKDPLILPISHTHFFRLRLIFFFGELSRKITQPSAPAFFVNFSALL